MDVLKKIEIFSPIFSLYTHSDLENTSMTFNDWSPTTANKIQTWLTLIAPLNSFLIFTFWKKKKQQQNSPVGKQKLRKL